MRDAFRKSWLREEDQSPTKSPSKSSNESFVMGNGQYRLSPIKIRPFNPDSMNPENNESPTMRIISPERNPFKNRSPSPKRDFDNPMRQPPANTNSMTLNLICIPEEEKEDCSPPEQLD